MLKLSRLHPPKLSLLSSQGYVHAWSVPPPGRCHQRERPFGIQFEKAIAKSEAAIALSGRIWENLCTRTASVLLVRSA